MKLRRRLQLLRSAVTGRVPMAGSVARYAGGAPSRILAQWFAELEDPNRHLRDTLSSLRARSRQLSEDNGEAEGLLKDFESDIVGHVGARLQFRARRPRGAPRDTLNDRVEAAWATWSQMGTCTLDGAFSLAALQRLVIRSVIRDGEFLALRVRAANNPFFYALQPVDPDQLDETLNREAQPGRNAIVMGVEVDGNGRPVAYHLWDRHPSLPGRQRRPEPAANVVHVFKRLRVGQVRGVPWFAPALVTWKLGDRYTEAELYQSLLAAAQGGFFESEEGGGFELPKGEDGKPLPLVMEAEPGTARVLPAGYKFTAWEPKHPTANYGVFMKAVKRIVARAFGRSYASVTGDLSDVNFSSMRIDREREKAQNRVHQHEILVEQFLDVVFRDWLSMQIMAGTLGAVAESSAALASFATWMLVGWPWIDPVKDATAALMELNMGVTSPQRIAAEKGRDYFEIIDEIADARAYAVDKKVPLEAVPLAIAVTVTDAPADPNADPNAAPTQNKAGRVLPLRVEAA